MNPRPYQSQCIEAVESGWEESSKQLVVMPTGGGKTRVFSWLAKRRLEKTGDRTLILAHREELIDQAIKAFYETTGIQAAKEKAESVASKSAPVVVGSIQTLCGEKRLQAWPRDHFGLVVVDEAHHSLASSYRGILKHFDGDADVLGVTATPDRADKRSLGEYFEHLAIDIPLYNRKESDGTITPGLIPLGYLARIVVKTIPMQIDLSAVKSVAGDFSDDELGHAVEPFLDDIAKEIRDNAVMRRVLGFTPLIQTAQKAAEACQKLGMRAEYIFGRDPMRKDKLQRMRNGEYDVLWNCDTLAEGYDEPAIDCIVDIAPTRSRVKYSQRVGRGTRLADGKENLLILDFMWSHERHRLCRPASLVASEEEQEDIITEIATSQGKGQQEELELGELASAAMHEREKRMLAKMAENKDKKSEFLSAEEFAARHESMDAFSYQPTMKWEQLPVHESQLKILKKYKIDIETVRCAGHARKLIELGDRHQKVKLASPKQIAFAQRLGWRGDVLTMGDFGRFMASRNYGKK